MRASVRCACQAEWPFENRFDVLGLPPARSQVPSDGASTKAFSCQLTIAWAGHRFRSASAVDRQGSGRPHPLDSQAPMCENSETECSAMADIKDHEYRLLDEIAQDSLVTQAA